MGLRTQREEGRLGLPLLAALSPFTLTLVYPLQWLFFFFSPNQSSFIFLLILFSLFASYHLPPSDSNLNEQCWSLFPLMCRLGPDAARYVGGILMAVGDNS